MKIKDMAWGFAIFYTIVVLISTAWSGFESGYSITEADNNNGLNVFERLAQVNLISGITALTNGIFKLTKTSSVTDLLGGLAVSGSGLLQTIGGIVTFPIEIVNAIGEFYPSLIPGVVAQLLGFVIVIAVGFILLSAKTGFEL